MNITENAQALLRTGEVERVDDARVYRVPSQTDATYRYVVSLSETAGPTCLRVGGEEGRAVCPAHRFSGVCKHILAAALLDRQAQDGDDPRWEKFLEQVEESAAARRERRAAQLERASGNVDEYAVEEDDGEVD